jgi:hypothetical protein
MAVGARAAGRKRRLKRALTLPAKLGLVHAVDAIACVRAQSGAEKILMRC